MNIKQLIKENYEIAKSKGFYPDDSKIEDHLMGIVSEIGEAYEAHRRGKLFSNINNGYFSLECLVNDISFGKFDNRFYMYTIKDTFEDELADVFIRLFNLCGHTNKEVIKLQCYEYDFFNVPSSLMMLSRLVISKQINDAYGFLIDFCNYHKIDIEKHILAKMQYNKTREYLHGKQY